MSNLANAENVTVTDKEKEAPKAKRKHTPRVAKPEPELDDEFEGVEIVQPSSRGKGNANYPWRKVTKLGYAFIVAAPKFKKDRENLEKNIHNSAYSYSLEREKAGESKVDFMTKSIRKGILVARTY